ncbi:LEAF RUST 10 DISEASE-RESISTANCE LOCUS RECEPTOR-LIKE PROTEIN KINASE-like 1.2 [Triticum dicoccoides]|uniref:LEAF RUST 10 DISEASE-RESISTANCE LOCUS RECEPTOR-LIKE PROTEIN KINASE-like 1.2 n=1 Tax=Triticum dicoccoides TaxID=85692 RepID=UPI00188EF642|nr:LEAF RUST 10 DISEASE-RESISTANCE LOCUS RECEPTOR-LIKE PROTEIN KINASE-like 1.2 [Triticum dicoccoides]
MSMLSLQLLLLPLASFLRTAASTTGTGSKGSCTQRSCGGLTIRYPFSLAGAQPLYCGYPAFDLTCDNGTRRSYLSNTFREHLFRVDNISYVDNTMMAAVQTAFAGDSGCPVPDFNLTASLALFPFNISSTNKRLVFFYNCTVPAEIRLRRSCGNHAMGAYISGHWDGGGENGTLPQGVSTNCSSVSVPVRRGLDRAHEQYERLIRDGFLLKLPAPLGDCDRCTHLSGGECRFDQFAFQCVCPDGKFCLNSIETNSTTHPDTDTAGTGADKNVGMKFVTGITSAVLFVIILGLVCHLVQLNRAKNKKRSASMDGLIREGSPLASLRKELNLAGSPCTHIFTYEELDAATDGFGNANELGAGGFGTVYKGVLRDGSVVAVKRLYKNSYKGVEQFANEVDILSRLRHPNLVALYGCTSSSPTCRDLLLVYEFVPNGTLADHLHHGKDGGGDPLLLPWPTRLGIAVEAAAALAYLHVHQVVHRDVKTTNILLDDGFHVKVADFGLSRLFPADGATQHVSTAPQGTPGYVDPAYHHRYQLTDKSDVYSFGVVLVELVSSRPAVDMARAGTDVNLGCMAVRMIQCCEIDRLVDPRLGYGSSASETKGTIDLVAEVAFRCLQPEQDVRPSIGEVLDVLRQAHQRITEKGASATTDGAVLLKKSRDGSPDSVMHEWISPSSTSNST